MRYRRAKSPGGTFFFTVNLADRDSDLLTRHIDDLRAALHRIKISHPFSLVAMVVLPDHLHAIWRLPDGDVDYPKRWSLLKAGFSRCVSQRERINPSRRCKRERGIWQRRYWEHQIRDEMDLTRHVDYIHYNPVKHGWVTQPVDWPHSTLHGYIKRGIMTAEWGAIKLDAGDRSYGER